MSIPEHFEFHYVQNGVKKSVTLFTALLFSKTPAYRIQPPPPKLVPMNQQRSG